MYKNHVVFEKHYINKNVNLGIKSIAFLSFAYAEYIDIRLKIVFQKSKKQHFNIDYININSTF